MGPRADGRQRLVLVGHQKLDRPLEKLGIIVDLVLEDLSRVDRALLPAGSHRIEQKELIEQEAVSDQGISRSSSLMQELTRRVKQWQVAWISTQPGGFRS